MAAKMEAEMAGNLVLGPDQARQFLVYPGPDLNPFRERVELGLG
jgi:hypothetical protein